MRLFYPGATDLCIHIHDTRAHHGVFAKRLINLLSRTGARAATYRRSESDLF